MNLKKIVCSSCRGLGELKSHNWHECPCCGGKGYLFEGGCNKMDTDISKEYFILRLKKLILSFEKERNGLMKEFEVIKCDMDKRLKQIESRQLVIDYAVNLVKVLEK